MENFEIRKLEEMTEFLDRLTEGKNPKDNTPVPQDLVLNDPEIIRFLFRVREVVLAVRRNGGAVGAKPGKRAFPLKCLEKFEYEEDKPITKLMAQIKDLSGDPDAKGISTKTVTDWLKLKGYLKDEADHYTGRKVCVVTPEGNDFGLYMEKRTSYYGRDYTVVLYGRSAQEYIVRNMEAILNGEIIGEA